MRERLPSTNVAWVRFRPGSLRGLSLCLVLSLLWEFFFGFPGFYFSTETNPLSSNSNRSKDPHGNQLLKLIWLPLNISVYCIYLNRISPETEPYWGLQTCINYCLFHTCYFFRSSGWEWRRMNGWICPGIHTLQMIMVSKWRRSGELIFDFIISHTFTNLLGNDWIFT